MKRHVVKVEFKGRISIYEFASKRTMTLFIESLKNKPGVVVTILS